jgi:hypothetical protein
LVELHLARQEAVLQIKGKGITITLPFSQLASDVEILSSLSPLHASCFGVYYGRALRASIEGREHLKKSKHISYLLRNAKGDYKVLYQNKDGTVGYIDEKTKKIYINTPTAIVKNNHLICQFDPSQACYLGILAGMSLEKMMHKRQQLGHDNVIDLFKGKPALTIVD